MVQMDRCKLTLDLPKFQPMRDQDTSLLTNQRPALTLDLPKVIIAPPSDSNWSVIYYFTRICLSVYSSLCLSRTWNQVKQNQQMDRMVEINF